MKNHPDFIILGCPRSGTSFLYDLIKQHPDIYLKSNKRPEPHFFALDSKFAKGFPWYFEQVFKEYSGELISGEASTTMFYCIKAISRIRTFNPDMKFIVLFRDPLERMISEFQKSIETGWEKGSFKAAIIRELEGRTMYSSEYEQTFMPGNYVDRSRYTKYLEEWFKYFPSINFFLGRTEDLIKSPLLFVQEVFDFLKVEKNVKIHVESANKNSTGSKPEVELDLILKLKNEFDNERSKIPGLHFFE